MKYLILAVMLCGCASREHMRETLKREHPDCFVTENLDLICPDPFPLEMSL